MCGIAGFIATGHSLSEDGLRATGLAMGNTLAHRGPDDFGVWTDAAAGVALAHRRLSILDLSDAGKQPMSCPSGRFVVVYNGEIYNFQELRDDLAARGHHFRGHSDTEVLLAGIAEWGLKAALERFNGMFAFALWDRHERSLTLARDRVGKKPLYYGWCGEVLLFGSELKALRAHPGFDAEIDRDALRLFVRFGWIPGPYSIFKRIRKLPAGTWLTVPAGKGEDAVSPQNYWSARAAAEHGGREPFAGSFDEAVGELEALLKDAVGGRMIADVALGALLSGGIDSSTVVALMQLISNRPVKTFSIGFDDAKYDEAPQAAAIARHLGTDHQQLYVTAEDGLDIIPRLPALYDEPFADDSQIPTFLVSRLARSGVTVALTGDGGDELFAGYTSYAEAMARWHKQPPLPHALRRGLAGGMEALAKRAWDAWAPMARRNDGGRRSRLAKLEKRFRSLPARDPVSLFALRKARVGRPGDFIIGGHDAPTAFDCSDAWPDVPAPQQVMMYLDFVAYLADDVLVKVDRASMGVGLEVRCPLLDWRIVEFAWSLPLSMRAGPGGSKRILRSLLERHVPHSLTDRPKRGFSVPIAAWLCGPLREWAEDLLSERRLQDGGFLRRDAVRRVWQQHLSGWANHEQLIWTLLMFQAWMAAMAPAGSPAPEADAAFARAAGLSA